MKRTEKQENRLHSRESRETQGTAVTLTIYRLCVAITYTDDATSSTEMRRDEGVIITYVKKTNNKATTSGLYKCKIGNWD